MAGLLHIHLDYNELPAEAMDHLAGATFRQLEELNLSSNKLGTQAVAALAKAPIFGRLQTLKLSYVEADDYALAAWLASPQMATVKVFEWSGNSMSDLGLARLANSPRVQSIEQLDLCSNNFGSVAPITNSAQLKKLQQLKLYSMTIDPADLDALRAALPDVEVQI